MKSATANEVRVIGGELRSRKISFSNADGLRPTSDRIRETLFNWIQFDLPGAKCLDLFSGSGALGIEAISRGASEVYFVEKNPVAAQEIETNLAKLNVASGVVNCVNASLWIQQFQKKSEPFSCVFLDPPFASNEFDNILFALDKSGLVAQNSKIYMEWHEPFESLIIPESWANLKTKKAGNVHYGLWQKS